MHHYGRGQYPTMWKSIWLRRLSLSQGTTALFQRVQVCLFAFPQTFDLIFPLFVNIHFNINHTRAVDSRYYYGGKITFYHGRQHMGTASSPIDTDRTERSVCVRGNRCPFGKWSKTRQAGGIRQQKSKEITKLLPLFTRDVRFCKILRFDTPVWRICSFSSISFISKRK